MKSNLKSHGCFKWGLTKRGKWGHLLLVFTTSPSGEEKPIIWRDWTFAGFTWSSRFLNIREYFLCSKCDALVWSRVSLSERSFHSCLWFHICTVTHQSSLYRELLLFLSSSFFLFFGGEGREGWFFWTDGTVFVWKSDGNSGIRKQQKVQHSLGKVQPSRVQLILETI